MKWSDTFAGFDLHLEDVNPRTLELPPMPPGEPGVVTPEKVEIGKIWLGRGIEKADVAKELGITRQTLHKYL
ncbi:hypothetical protein [Deinococcus marmoris]|uniref:Resolvase HTH domain-containing protein n=1 Tax=Deinococcus marmoris TaxID=249408 RepID=A0A1U7NR27_9DEIO|nr:hypothetical protein [Deinococcus marmoris]OLV15366.1 hypothetical protein BOO71_0015154 [Deinococcus marmoris]